MNFLFDIGRVLLDFDFESSLATLLPPDTPDPPARLRRLLARKDEFEKGLVAEEEYVAWALETLGSTASPDAFQRAWRGIFTPNEPMWRVVESLAADGHRLILFSNTNAIHVPWILDEFAVFRHFPAGVFSFRVQSIKPEPAIYHHALREHGIAADETCYIDDLAENIATGRALGLRCWQYDQADHASFEAWLRDELAAGSSRGA